MQDADVEIQQLCHRFWWLADIHVFVNRYSDATLESLIGRPVSSYEKTIKKIRHCAELVNEAPSFISTSNQLFTVDCTNMKQRLGVNVLKYFNPSLLR